MHSLRSRYILSHILPIIIVAPLVMAVLLYLLEAQVFLQDLSADLGQRAILIAQATTDSAEIPDGVDHVIHDITDLEHFL